MEEAARAAEAAAAEEGEAAAAAAAAAAAPPVVSAQPGKAPSRDAAGKGDGKRPITPQQAAAANPPAGIPTQQSQGPNPAGNKRPGTPSNSHIAFSSEVVEADSERERRAEEKEAEAEQSEGDPKIETEVVRTAGIKALRLLTRIASAHSHVGDALPLVVALALECLTPELGEDIRLQSCMLLSALGVSYKARRPSLAPAVLCRHPSLPPKPIPARRALRAHAQNFSESLAVGITELHDGVWTIVCLAAGRCEGGAGPARRRRGLFAADAGEGDHERDAHGRGDGAAAAEGDHPGAAAAAAHAVAEPAAAAAAHVARQARAECGDHAGAAATACGGRVRATEGASAGAIACSREGEASREGQEGQVVPWRRPPPAVSGSTSRSRRRRDLPRHQKRQRRRAKSRD